MGIEINKINEIGQEIHLNTKFLNIFDKELNQIDELIQ